VKEEEKHCGKAHGGKGAKPAEAGAESPAKKEGKGEPEEAAKSGGKDEKAAKPAKVDPTAHHSTKVFSFSQNRSAQTTNEALWELTDVSACAGEDEAEGARGTGAAVDDHDEHERAGADHSKVRGCLLLVQVLPAARKGIYLPVLSFTVPFAASLCFPFPNCVCACLR
jgi:hypothetical protein